MTDPTPRHLAIVEPPDDGHIPPPADLAAERAVLGGMIHDRTTIEAVLDTVTGPEFYRPSHELIFDTIAALHLAGEPVDKITITNRLGKHLPRAGGQAYLEQLTYEGIAAADPAYYATIVAEKASQRRLVEAGMRITQLGYMSDGTTTITDLWDAAKTELETGAQWLPANHDTIPGQTIDDLLAAADREYDWLIPGFLEHRDRLILTGAEGAGKSTLLRTWAMQAAAGIHPFTHEDTRPIRTLVVDLENSEDQNRREYRPLRLQADRLNPANLILISKLDGIDLTSPDGERWLDRVVAHHRPQLLVTGPIYKLAGGNPNDEKDAKPAAMALDRIRSTHGCALLLEAHSRKADGNNPKHRPKEPFGWSGWLRWPEFGIHIAEDGEISHWRGQRDRNRKIPTQMTRGGRWPWNPATSVADQRWVAIRTFIRATGRKVTYREIRDATGLRMEAISAVMNEHSADLAALYFEMDMEQS